MISVGKLNELINSAKLWELMKMHGISRLDQHLSDDAREVILRAHYSSGEIREAHFSPDSMHWRDIKFLPTKKLEWNNEK